MFFTNCCVDHFGPKDNWGNQHAFRYPKGLKPPEEYKHVDFWRHSPYFRNLRGDKNPGCGYLHEGARLLAEDEHYQEAMRLHLAAIATPVDEAWKIEQVRVTAEIDAEIRRHEALEAQKTEVGDLQQAVQMVESQQEQFNELQHTQVNEPLRSEPSEPSLQSVVEAITTHQASKKKETRQKKPPVLKTNKRKTRSETSDDDELAFYELDSTGKGREIPKKKAKTSTIPSAASKSVGIKKTAAKARGRSKQVRSVSV